MYQQQRSEEERFQQNINIKQLNEQVKLGFIRKVYTIISTQLLVTVAMIYLSMTNLWFQKQQQSQWLLLILSVVLTLISSLTLLLSRRLARSVPINYILLSIFTVSMSYMVSFTCTLYDPKVVLMAGSLTLAVTLALTIYAFSCKQDHDYTLQGLIFFVLSLVSLIVAIALIFTNNKFLHILYAALSLILYAFYLVYDTQLILSNKAKAISYDDYIIGSIMIYTDIIEIFIKLLKLLDKLQEKKKKD